jgi:UDP:flavonoid glycosyltransferase YjiC (YdhE family)
VNVLVCAMDSPGFAYQAIGLAKAIAARGHRAACVASTTVADLFARHDVERVPRPGKDGPSFRLWRWSAAEATLLALLHVEHAARLARPDVIVAAPLGYGPALAAERLGVPLVVIGGLTFLWAPGTERHDDGWRWYLAGRAAAGLAAPDPAAARGFPPWLGERFLLQSAPSLTGSLAWPQCRWIGDGSWDPPEPAGELEDWIEARRDRRLVYVQMGREFGITPLLEILEEPARRLGLAVVMATAHGDREPTRTEDWLWARPFVPRAAVIPRAHLVIGSGQPTTVLGALTHGVPCVLYPCGSGTEETAAACRDRGVALTEPLTEATPASVTELVARALDDRRLRAAAAEVGIELRAQGGLDAAARLVLEAAAEA